jgi:hypothetical protein
MIEDANRLSRAAAHRKTPVGLKILGIRVVVVLYTSSFVSCVNDGVSRIANSLA